MAESSYTLMIVHEGRSFLPIVEDKVKWSTERAGSPGSLTFSVFNDGSATIANGDVVYFKDGDIKVFYGFVFTIKQKKDHVLDITAYDQLRYLKNKHTYNYKEKETGDLIWMMAEDFRLNCGELSSTGYPLTRTEKDKTLFDMVGNSLDRTVQATGQLFVLYDDFGSLTLKNIGDMQYNLLIDEETAQDFTYSRSIDSNTYNKVKLTYEDSSSGGRQVYIAQSGENMNKWGVLQYTDTVDKAEDGPSKANALLNLYNEETRNLTINDAFGDSNIRAGSLLAVKLEFDDISISNLMLVEKADHTYQEGLHTMDLTVRGGKFTA